MSTRHHDFSKPSGNSSSLPVYIDQSMSHTDVPQSGRRGHLRGAPQNAPRIMVHPPPEQSQEADLESQPLRYHSAPHQQRRTFEDQQSRYTTAQDRGGLNDSRNPPQRANGSSFIRHPPSRPARPNQEEDHEYDSRRRHVHATPPFRPLPSKIPQPVIEALPRMPPKAPPRAASPQEMFDLNSKRPPLGPPPSARRGPASYYPRIAPVHPIVEESDSLRGSKRSSDHSSADEAPGQHQRIGIIPSETNLYNPKHAESTVDLAIHRPKPSMGRSMSSSESHQRQQTPGEQQVSGAREHIFRQSYLEPPNVASRVEQVGAVNEHHAEDVPLAMDVHSRTPSMRSTSPQQFDMKYALAAATQDRRPISRGDLMLQSGERTPTDSGDESRLAVTAPTSLKSRSSSDRLSRNSATSEDWARIEHPPESPSSGKGGVPRSRLSATLSAAPTSVPLHSLSPSLTSLRTVVQSSDVHNTSEKTRPQSPNPDQDRLPAATPGFSSRQKITKPPPALLNVDTIREAELRGSMTSLPDLIRRATKLASNLDRGRTASRLGVNWMGAEDEKRTSNRLSSGLSDIIASFPPPAVATPPVSRDGDVRWSAANLSSRNRHSTLRSNSDASGVVKPQRRCCGLTPWKFVLLAVALLLLLAAAIAVPICLTLLPKLNHQNSNVTNGQLAQCQQTTTCENGGLTTYTGGACSCICINGYTGSRCGSASQQGCTTTSVGSMSDATVGSDIPRIISNAQSQFGIPLDGQTLLGLFSSVDLSCNTENALVTFTNVVQRDLQILPAISSRDDQRDAEATTNGIVFATSTTSASSAAATSASATSQTSNFTTTTDFARTAVLYIFQSSGELNSAVNAQTNLQDYFTNTTSTDGSSFQAANITLGDGFSCDLTTLQLVVANGTIIGGGAA